MISVNPHNNTKIKSYRSFDNTEIIHMDFYRLNNKTNIYDLDITLDVQSKSDNNYNVEHKSSNRIFSINKFLQTSNQ